MSTINDYIGLLKSNQQEYLVWCIQHYTERKDFHRGLLPFITTQEVSIALKVHLQVLKDKIALDLTVRGERFIRGILTLIEATMLKNLCEEEASTIMFLKTVKLAQTLRRHFDNDIVIKLADAYGGIPIHDGYIKLKMVGRDKWKVSCSKRLLERATIWLAESFR